MKESAVQKLPKEHREFYLNHKNSIDSFIEYVFTDSLEQAYLVSLVEETEYPDALSNYAVKIAYQKGYQACLLKQLKLLNYNMKKLIPNEWRVV